MLCSEHKIGISVWICVKTHILGDFNMPFFQQQWQLLAVYIASVRVIPEDYIADLKC